MASLNATARLTAEQTAAALALVAKVTEIDGLAPLSEHVLLHLRHGGDEGGEHFLVHDDGQLVGYGHLDRTDAVNGPSAELAVDPAHRRCGIGRSLVDAMTVASGDGRMRLWAHGELAPAGALARSLGFTDARVLWQMRRSLHAELPPVTWPTDVSLRTFLPGIDDEAWVALNHRAFIGHPEQANWTLRDLHRRMAEPWFSPTGFLIAESEGQMVGFHWTKVHGLHDGHEHPHAHAEASSSGVEHGHEHGHGHEAIGEVYVVGVDPAWQGHGLGRSLTVAGLQHLRSLGLGQAMLYVEAANTRAIDLYRSLGFTQWDTDVMYQLQTAN